MYVILVKTKIYTMIFDILFFWVYMRVLSCQHVYACVLASCKYLYTNQLEMGNACSLRYTCLKLIGSRKLQSILFNINRLR